MIEIIEGYPIKMTVSHGMRLFKGPRIKPRKKEGLGTKGYSSCASIIDRLGI